MAETPSGAALTRELRVVLWLFAALALAAGFLLFVLADQTDETFSWTIQPPLTAAFLGASYWAAFVLLAWTARQQSWQRARPALPPVLTIAVLLLVATLLHDDKFDFDSIFGWFWLIAYIVVPPLLAVLVWRQLRAGGGDADEDGDSVPLPGWVRLVLGLQGAMMLGLGASLFVDPAGTASIWPWALTPLTGRAVGAFLIGFGVSAADAVFESDLRRFEGAALAYATLGALQLLALLLHSEDLDGGSGDSWLYAGFVASVLAIGVYGSLRALRLRSGSSDASAASTSS
jgi:hypothetical protein